MNLPKYLIADNYSECPNAMFVIHTQNPSFILNVDTAECLLLDDTSISENKLSQYIEAAFEFYEKELNFDEENDNEEETYGFYDGKTK